MPLLFSYGTLQIPDMQLATFGRLLRGEKDEAVACERQIVAIDDPAVISATGRGEHVTLRFNGRMQSRVAGTVLEVSEAELAEADKYETLARFKRRHVLLASARTVWAYVYSPD